MPGDFSRKTYDKTKHYSRVNKQQGRVELDADWNEEMDIEEHRTFTETIDVIGTSGVPKKNDGFKVTVSPDGTDLVIKPGRIYLQGLLCELEPGVTTYRHQPYYPAPDLSNFNLAGSPPGSPAGSPPAAKLMDGSYIVYIKAWQREINYLDDPYIQEKALGEADTTTRLQIVWQIKLLKVQDSNGSGNCSSSFPEWDALTAPLTGLLAAQTKTPEDNKNPCVLPPSAGYLRLENQLYRVQVQKTDSAKKAQSFKWSRDNASIETIIENVSDKVLTVSSIGKDDVLGFAGNQWVEIVDDISTLNGIPYPLVQIDSINPDSRKITLKTSVSQFETKKGLKLRRWDIDNATVTGDGLPVAPGWLDIEDGIQVAFGNGTFEAGDYWLIPGRTATGNIEWPQLAPGVPLDQPRIGTNYFYCRLAFIKVQSGAVIVQEDCRNLFPSLTDMEECDLKEHNKYLHGYGVVCGLKVKCGPDRNRVIIETGYALDCEGNAIKNKTAIDFNVLAAAANPNLLNAAGNGIVCLTIGYNRTSQPIIYVEPFVKQSLLNEILEGSLLKDFLDGCIKSLINALKADLKSGPQAVPVPVEQRRLTALINLLAQLINPKSQQYSYISGDKTKKHNLAQCIGGNLTDKDEDNLLYCFYEKLKMLLASETYCAEFDHQSFPEYTIDPGLETIFGTPLKTHQRLRVDAEGKFAYTCKDNNQVYEYNLTQGEFVRWFDFPAPNVQVQDVCVSKNGSELYVVGISGNNSVFGIVSSGTSANPGTWKGPFTVNNLKFTTLAMHMPTVSLFGIAKARGFYKINLSSTGIQVDLLNGNFNATGLMVVSDDSQLAFAVEDAVTPVGTESANFSVIRVMNLAGQVLNKTLVKGNDSANDMVYSNNFVYVTGDGPASNPSMRILARFPAANAAGGNNAVLSTNLEPTNEVLRLAVIRQNQDKSTALVSFSDQSKVLRVTAFPNKLEMEKGFRIPVQLFPMDMAVGNKEQSVYVLNMGVNTITAIAVDKVLFAALPPNFTQEPPEVIADYRDDVLAAYKGLFKNLLQYLKDCFCDKFLIDCPDCSEKDKVYLGIIEIRASKIYHICNFTKRKYVKTSRTVEYWLSTIPVLPLLKKAFTTFCCSVIGSKVK